MRYVVFVAALGLWAAPAVAKQQKLQLDPPTMSARQDRCTPKERALCEGVAGQRAIDHDLSCDSCPSGTASMPAEIISPTPGDTPRPAKSLKSSPGQDCEPGAADSDRACPPLPPLDTLPRP